MNKTTTTETNRRAFRLGYITGLSEALRVFSNDEGFDTEMTTLSPKETTVAPKRGRPAKKRRGRPSKVVL